VIWFGFGRFVGLAFGRALVSNRLADGTREGLDFDERGTTSVPDEI
jgi:hypothetical protein